MDHSIFGSLMDIKGDLTQESHCSQDGYVGEGNGSYFPENSVEDGYGSDFYSLATNLDVDSTSSGAAALVHSKFKNNTNKKKLASKYKELRFKCTQCGYKTWKKSNFQRHLLTHNKKLYRCTLCSFSGKHADDLQKHIACHKKKEPRIATTTVSKHVIEIKDIRSLQEWNTKVWSIPVSSNTAKIKSEPEEVINLKLKEELEVTNVKVKQEPEKNQNVSTTLEVDENFKDNLKSLHEWNTKVTSNMTKNKCEPEEVINLKLKEEIEVTNVKVKQEPEECSAPEEVDLDEQSSNSIVPESSVEEGYDSDFYPLTVNIDITTPHEAYNSPPPVTITHIKKTSVSEQIAKEAADKLNKNLKFSCPYCSYRTWKTSNFQRHLTTHANDRPHKCHLCKYSGKHPENLKKHMICHNKDITIVPILPPVSENKETELLRETLMDDSSAMKRFSCLQCDFKTTRSSVLNRHQIVRHNEYRPYACDLCPYRSKQRDSLKKHMMAHTDVRPFECDICHHRCRQKGDLKRHKLLHTGEKPYACPYCVYRSNRTQLLKRHVARRHAVPDISSEITVTKTNVDYGEFTGGHYLAEMF